MGENQYSNLLDYANPLLLLSSIVLSLSFVYIYIYITAMNERGREVQEQQQWDISARDCPCQPSYVIYVPVINFNLSLKMTQSKGN